MTSLHPPYVRGSEVEPTRVAKDAGIWARQGEDWYVEPEWCSKRLFETERFDGGIYDPACGMGRIVNSAHDAGWIAFGNDIVSRGNYRAIDFLSNEGCECPTPNIVSNPPFDISEQFVKKALLFADQKVVMLLPATWHCGDKRSRWLETTPLRKVLFLTPRPSMPPGHVILAGGKPGGGTKDFAWFIWEQGFEGCPELGWLRRDA
jgi:hypothetical protein